VQGDHNDRLKTTSRPEQVGEFLSWHRQLERQPAIKNLETYGKTWEGWHSELRKKDSYEDMAKGGGNGIFLLILALRWWMDVNDESEEGGAKTKRNERLAKALKGLEQSMGGILESRVLMTGMEEMEVTTPPRKRYVPSYSGEYYIHTS
jgi:hypothetical protein